MAIRVAYGKRDNIQSAIEAGTVPAGSIIITRDDDDHEELFFYDTTGVMKSISYRDRFESIAAVQAWIEKYPCHGHILTVVENGKWHAYQVSENNLLIDLSDTGEDTYPQWGTI